MPRTKTTSGDAATGKRTRKAASEPAPVPAPAPARTPEEQAIQDKYGVEVKPGSMRYDEVMKKKSLVIFCAVCHKPRQIWSQDAFQVKCCSAPCKKALKKSQGVGR
jgi:hypothetical protein